jgi:GT2 family glycosyltransferase
MPDFLPVTHGIVSKDRPALLARSLKSLNEQTRLPEAVVIVDCSENTQATLDVINTFRRNTSIPRVTYEFRDRLDWSRSKGRNLCCELAESPLTVSTETDILFEPRLYELAIALFGNPPYKRLYAYPLITKLQRNGEPQFEPQDDPIIGYFQMFRREDFAKIGGYNPFLVGWGHEDSDFSDRLMESGVARILIPSVATHMWHLPAYSNLTDKRRQIDDNIRRAKETKWDGIKWVKA